MKTYRKKGVQPMRPYLLGEDMTGISVAACDTPCPGGMIAVNASNPSDKWYVAKEFFEANYDEVADAPAPESFQDRVRAEKDALDEKLEKLGTFLATPVFDSLPDAEKERLFAQLEVMTAYSNVLCARIAAFE